jgi:hypothetical protein
MQGYKVKEKTAIVPPVSKLSGHPESCLSYFGWSLNTGLINMKYSAKTNKKLRSHNTIFFLLEVVPKTNLLDFYCVVKYTL